MNWGQARKLLHLAVQRRMEPENGSAPARRGGFVDDPSRASETNGSSETNGKTSDVHRAGTGTSGDSVPEQRAVSICVVSGKGGTGKSVLCSSLSTMLAQAGATLIVDADLGIGNAHILQGVSPEFSFVDVTDGRLSVPEIVQRCRPGLDLLSAGSGISSMASLTAYEMHLIAAGIEHLEQDYEYLVIDSAAGISPQTAAFAATCDCVLLVTTPDLTAMTDAYAFLKVLYGRNRHANVQLVVNRTDTKDEGDRTAKRIRSVSDRFLGCQPELIATLPEDSAVRRAGNQRTAVVLAEPESPIAAELRGLYRTLLAGLAGVRADPTHGIGRRLVAECGYSSGYNLHS